MDSIVQYHDLTSYDRMKIGGGYIDWSNQPDPYKIYENCERTPLPGEISFPSLSFWEVLRAEADPKLSLPKDMVTMSRLLILTCSITAKGKYWSGEFHYRSTPSAGALYPTELYVSTTAQGPLSPGLYHYELASNSLVSIKDLPKEDKGRMLFFITGRFFRSAWKYGERAYRYVLLDGGHTLENLHLALKCLRFNHAIEWNFPDEVVNLFLGLDSQKEATLAIVHLGHRTPEGFIPFEEEKTQKKIAMARDICSREEVPPLIRRVHELTCSAREGSGYEPEMVYNLGVELHAQENLPSSPSVEKETRYVDVLWSRRSRRAYVPKELDREVLGALVRGIEIEDERSSFDPRKLIAVGVLVSKVHGLEPGFYLMGREPGSLFRVVRRDFSREMAAACLNQEWVRNSAVQFLFLCNLKDLERSFGPRSYRYAMLLSGRIGQRIYLGATALGLGACGIGAFYDTEAREILGLNEDSRLLYLITVGHVRGKGE